MTFLQSDKGIPVVRRGRKATGLRDCEDSGAAGDAKEGLARGLSFRPPVRGLQPLPIREVGVMSKTNAFRLGRLVLMLGLLAGLTACNENVQPNSLASSAVPASVSAPIPAVVVSGVPAVTKISVGHSFKFTPTAGSTDGKPLAFMLMNGPAFLSVDSVTGEVSGTPSVVDIGDYNNIHVVATDGVVSSPGPHFSLQVIADASSVTPSSATGALTLSGSPITAAVEGVSWSFRPVATAKVASSALTFRVTNAPAWLTFNAATGTLAGTPPAGSVGTYSNIVISVTDATAEAALPPFALSVSAPSAPTIAGKPSTTAQVGSAYAFRPTATASGMSLAFKVTGLPSWASFDPTTGSLTGTPPQSAGGSQSTITISVSNGFTSASLPSFVLTVVAPVSGSATLSWVAPTQRTDNSALTNLAGFRIYYGKQAGSYPNSVSVTNAALTSYALSALPAGTYYFVVTAFDTNGVESNYSVPVSKTIG